MNTRLRWSATVFAIVIVLTSATVSQGAPASGPALDPTAMRILQSATDYLKQQQSYAFSADIVFDDVLPPDFKILHHATAQYSAHRPNQLRVDYTGDRRQANFYLDGKTFTLYDRAANAYGVLDAASDIDTTLNTIFDKYDFTVPLGDIVSNDPYKAFASALQSGYYVGKDVVRGFSTHHLVFVQKDIDWQLWVDDGATPLIRELEITYKNLPGQPEYMATITDWSFAAIPSTNFTFVAPKNAALIDFVTVQSTTGQSAK